MNIWIIALLAAAAMGIGVLIVTEYRRYKELTQPADIGLDKMYAEIWDGTELDRIYAWYRLIRQLERWENYPDSLLREAYQRMEAAKQHTLSRSRITRNGKVILKVTVGYSHD